MNDSNTPTPPNAPQNPRNCQCQCDAGVDNRGYAIFCILIGVFLILFMPRFFQWLSHRLLGSSFNPIIDSQTGAIVPYTQSIFFLPDLGPALFALASILEGVALSLKPRKWLILLAGGFMGITTLFNAGYVIFSFNLGFAPVSFLAAAFGAYSTLTLLKILGFSKQSPGRCGCDPQTGGHDCGCRH